MLVYNENNYNFDSIHYQNHYTNTYKLCRKCQLKEETFDHVTSGCIHLAGTEYKDRHNYVAKIIHKAICRKFMIPCSNESYHIYKPNQMIENHKIRIYWNKKLSKSQLTHFNQPDILLINKYENKAYIIEISIPKTRNLNSKYNEKIQKYIRLANELQINWQLNEVKIMPFVISVQGIYHDSFMENLQSLRLPYYIRFKAKKSVIIKTKSIVKSFYQS